MAETTPLKVRTIDIFVSSPEDVQKERSLAERVIRSVASEFGVPVTVNYSNWLRKIKTSDKVPVLRTNGSDDGRTWLRSCFWEYQDADLDQDYREQIPNTGSYDLVVSILWSRLGTKLSPAFIMPDGTTPKTPNEYEIAWVLDQLARTPDFPKLHVYRNQSTPSAPIQPREQREAFFREWDAVQDFFAAWGKHPTFNEACSEYSDLHEFESLFREHFRAFLKMQVAKEIVPRKTPAKGRSWDSEPFRGLQYFDFEHAPIFHGRTKAIGEVVDALKEQAIAKNPFVLVLGPSGSGKTSLIRGGVLPLLSELATVMGEGPWRRAITRPGSGGDPIEGLAAALLADGALPELQESENAQRPIADALRERPETVALRIGEALDQISTQELDLLLNGEKDQSPVSGRIESIELARHRRLRRVKPKAQLAIFVDQLEDLFTSSYPEKVQRSYISTIATLVRSRRIHVIAALRSEFYSSYQQLSELVALANPNGRFDLQPPTRNEVERIVRSPAEAAGLKFDRDSKTGKSLDETLIDAAVGSAESLPLLQHLLSQLYSRQSGRKDGWLRWGDYRELHEFDGALPEHAERVFNSLSIDAQQTFDSVMRKLVCLEHDGRAGCRPVPYQDLISSRDLDGHLQTSAQTFVDRMVAEGLFSAQTDYKQELIVQVAHSALLRNWPRVQEWLSAEQEFVRMRDRVDGCLKLWLRKGRQTHDLLTPGLNLADGETLLNHFHSSLSAAQIEYIQKSLNGQKRSRRSTYAVLVAVLVALACAATIAAVQRLTSEGKRAIILEYGNLERKIGELVQAGHGRNQTDVKQGQDKSVGATASDSAIAAQRSGLETQLKGLQDKLREEEQATELAAAQRSASEAQLRETQEKLQDAQQSATLAAAQSATLNTKLGQAQEKLQQNQQTRDSASNQRPTLEDHLKQAEENLQQAQHASDLWELQRTALEAQLKQTQDKLQTLQQAADQATAQRASLEGQLKEAQDKLQLNQQATEAASSQRSALEAQLKQTQDKLRVAQQASEQATTERASLETQLKQAQDKLQLNQQATETASSQRTALETQLKQAQDKLQVAQQASEQATTERASLETQLKQAQEKLQLNQQATETASSQRSALEAQLQQAQDKLQLAQKSADDATTKRAGLESQLKEAQDKLQLNQQAIEADSSQRSALEAKLKQAQDKLQIAEKNADDVTAQRASLESQLKEARDKLQLNQRATDASSSQRAYLEAQLKQSQDRLQLAQQNADEAGTQAAALEVRLTSAEEEARAAKQQADQATSQRTALESRLKDLEEKAQLAQKIADLVAAQARSTATGESPADPQSRSTEPAAPGRSGRALPLDAAQNPGAKTLTQPLSPSAQPPNQ
jgi:hypothetical protein